MLSRQQISHIEVWVDSVSSRTTAATYGRPLPNAQPLALISSNPRLNKRKLPVESTRINPPRSCKRAKTMARGDVKNSDGYAQGQRDIQEQGDIREAARGHGGQGRGQPPVPTRGRRRGRPPGPGRGRGRSGGAPSTQNGSNVPPPDDEWQVDQHQLSHRPVSQQTPRTPSRARGVKSVLDIKPNTSIDLKFLESCTPSVKVRTLQAAKAGGQIPQAALDLFNAFQEAPDNCIPGQLEVSTYDW